jgi:hypothetical protein
MTEYESEEDILFTVALKPCPKLTWLEAYRFHETMGGAMGRVEILTRDLAEFSQTESGRGAIAAKLCVEELGVLRSELETLLQIIHGEHSPRRSLPHQRPASPAESE